MENDNNRFICPNSDSVYQLHNDQQTTTADITEKNVLLGNTRDFILPNIFVRIPINSTDAIRCAAHNFTHRDNQIKSEPIKSELADAQTTIQHSNHHQTIEELALSSAKVNEIIQDSPGLVTARPKSSIKSYKCEKCPFISISQHVLDAHITDFHSNDDGNITPNNTKTLHCPGCENVFYVKQSMESHLENDHQMNRNEAKLLTISIVNDPSLAESEQSRSRISLKNVDFLRSPNFNKDTLEDVDEECPAARDSSFVFEVDDQTIDNNLILIDLINSDSQNQTNISVSNPSQNKIFIKNVDILREPDAYLTNNLDNDNSVNPGLDTSSKVYNDLNTDCMNKCSEEPSSLPLFEDNTERTNRAKIYIKNVDILKKPIFVPPNNLTNVLNVNDDLSLNLFPSTDDQLPLHSTSTEEIIQSDLSSYYNLDSNRPKSKIYIKNVDILKQSHLDHIQKRATNSLHLRTVDELNLMNMNEVQNLITPVLDQSSINNQSCAIASSENSKNSDEVVLNSHYSLPDLAYNQDTGFNVSESELIPSNWSQDYNFDSLDNIMESTTSSAEFDQKNPSKRSEFDLNTPQRIVNEESDQDILFVCAQELINNANEERELERQNFNGESYTVSTPFTFLAPQQIEEQDVVEILDDLEKQTICGEESNLNQEKGRIYVADNLLEIRGDKFECNASVKKSRGRPFGARKTGITKLKKAGVDISAAELEFKCDLDCGLRFRKLETLDFHRKCHSGAMQRMQCPNCNDNDFSSWNTLHTHLWRHHQIDMELYSCEHCSFKTPILSRLVNTHSKIHSDERNFKCDQCDKAFKNTKQLKNHRRWHRSLSNDVQRCNYCGATFFQIKTLMEHIQKYHTEPESESKCNTCSKVMSSQSSLKLHLLTHENSNRFKCEICSYTCNDHNTFRRHKMIHNEDKMYKCQFCDYKCIQSNLYQKHTLRKHPELASQVILKCESCTYSTINRTNYEIHISTKHESTINTLEDNIQSSNSIENEVNPFIEFNGFNNTYDFYKNGSTNSSNLDSYSQQRNKIKVKSNLVLTDPTKFCAVNPLLLQNLDDGIT